LTATKRLNYKLISYKIKRRGKCGQLHAPAGQADSVAKSSKKQGGTTQP
jgi:hypothetical protein